jgi:hypothetical protein
MAQKSKTQFYEKGSFTVDSGGLWLGDHSKPEFEWDAPGTCISAEAPASVYFDVDYHTTQWYDQLNTTKEVYFYTTPKPSEARVELKYDQFREFLRRHLEAGGEVADDGHVATIQFDKMSQILSDMGL